MTDSSIRVEVRDFVATITLDRPEVRNAIDLPTAKALECAIDEAERSDDVRVIVLAATGPVFSAGMDLKALTATGDRPAITATLYQKLLQRDPDPTEVEHLEDLYTSMAAVGGPKLDEDWRAMSCFAVATTSEAIFY